MPPGTRGVLAGACLAPVATATALGLSPAMPDRPAPGPDGPTMQAGARGPAPDDPTIALGAPGTGAAGSTLPERLGPHRVVRELGRGGMGVVLLAHDARLQRDIAIQLLPADAGAADAVRERFLSEARTLATMNHPNIATIRRSGPHGSPMRSTTSAPH